MGMVATWSGREAQALRVARRLSVRAFAARLGVARGTVVNWERRGDQARLRSDTQEILDADVRLADDTIRQRFETALARQPRSAGTGTDAGRPTVPPALAERIASARRVDRGAAALLAQQTQYLRTLDCRVSATSLADQMTGHLATIQEALSRTVLLSVRQPLAAVLADAAALAAWQALDVGAIDRAWQYHETARYAALEARSTVLLTHAMAQQAFVLVDIDEVSSAIELVREARREAGTSAPPRFRAWLHAAEAEVFAAGANNDGMNRGFDRAAELVPPGACAVDPDMPFIVLNSAHLARWRGNVSAKLGSTDALTDLYAALDENGTVSDRAEASLRCDLAQVHLRRGEDDEARKQAVEALKLARRAGSVRQRQRIQRLGLV